MNQGTSVTTGAMTQHFDGDGNPVYPCRCGETHGGDYGVYDYGHHNCFHDEPLIPAGPDNFTDLLCPSCGKTFSVRYGEAEHRAAAERAWSVISQRGDAGVWAWVDIVIEGWPDDTEEAA